jgi:hypothetical protein
MQVTVKLLTGKRISMNVEGPQKVADLKRQINDKEGISPDQIKLIWKGKQLEDNKTIEESKLEAGAQIHMVLQLRGGF